MLLLQKQGVLLAETGGFVAAAETVQLWDRAGAALGVLRGDGGDSRSQLPRGEDGLPRCRNLAAPLRDLAPARWLDETL